MELDKQDSISLKDLSEQLYLDKSTLSRTIEGLVNLGLVDRVIPRNNRRSIIIKLTEQGASVCKKINTSNNKYYQMLLDSLPKDQLSIFIESFKTIVAKMIEMNSGKSTN
jgi:DNA-binding MarR family transcriptional regulator